MSKQVSHLVSEHVSTAPPSPRDRVNFLDLFVAVTTRNGRDAGWLLLERTKQQQEGIEMEPEEVGSYIHTHIHTRARALLPPPPLGGGVCSGYRHYC